MEPPDPKRYREAEVAFENVEREAQSYRGFLRRGRILAPLRRLLGGSEWDFRNPYLPQDEAERFRRRLLEFGVDARWEGDVLLISDPGNRWHEASIARSTRVSTGWARSVAPFSPARASCVSGRRWLLSLGGG